MSGVPGCVFCAATSNLAHSNPGSGCLKRILGKGAFFLFRLALVAVALLTLFIAFTPQGRAGFHTALFVSQVLEMPVKPESWFADEPLHQEVHYQSADGTDVAEVYRLPDGEPRAAVLLSLGVSPIGLDDPNVINLGNALARAGYVAMFHWSPTVGLRANIDPDGPDKLVWAFLYLADREYVDRERVGLGGFCVGASFALVAAADPRIRDQVAFVNALGPFFDAETLLLQAASRTVTYEGERTPWEPDPLTLRVLANELIETVDNAPDAELLTRHYLDSRPATPAELDALAPPGRTVSRLLEGVQPHEAATLYLTLPLVFREGLAGISPSTHVGDLRARLWVMHDRYDTLVPVAESRRLLEATQERGNVRYTEFLAFDHVTPSSGGVFTLLGQAARLWRHMYDIIRIAS